MNITFRGIAPEDVGAWLASIPVYTPSAKTRNTWQIPNRMGDLLELTFGRTSGKFDILIHSKATNWEKSKRSIEKWLNGTGKLVLSDANDSYYEVQDVTLTEYIKKDSKYGRIRAIMTVFPYEFLNSGDTGVTSFPIVNNAMESMPLYKIEGNGSGILTVNGHTMTYEVNGTLYIDTRRFIAYDANSADKNNKVNGDYAGLFLKEGSNSISATVGTLTVYPKWGYIK